MNMGILLERYHSSFQLRWPQNVLNVTWKLAKYAVVCESIAIVHGD